MPAGVDVDVVNVNMIERCIGTPEPNTCGDIGMGQLTAIGIKSGEQFTVTYASNPV